MADSTSYKRFLSWFSVFLRSRKYFLILVLIVACIKVLISIATPASTDLATIVSLASPRPSLKEQLPATGSPLSILESLITQQLPASGSPWVILESLIISSWEFMPWVTHQPQAWLTQPPLQLPADLYVLSLLVRLPILIFDLGVGFLLNSLVAALTGSSRTGRLAGIIWFLNPLSTFMTEMIGTPDIAAAFLTVLAAKAAIDRKLVAGSVALGLGATIKLYPILLLPLFLLYLRGAARDLRTLVICTILPILGVIGYFAWLLRSGVSASSLAYSLSVYTPVTQPIAQFFTSTVGAGFNVTIIALIFLYFSAWSLIDGDGRSLSDLFLSFFLVFYCFSDVYPQYITWALPFLTVNMCVNRRRSTITLSILAMILIFTWGLLNLSGYLSPNGYTLLFIRIDGYPLNWFSSFIISLPGNPVFSLIVNPFLRAAFSATTLVYAFEIARGWFASR